MLHTQAHSIPQLTTEQDLKALRDLPQRNYNKEKITVARKNILLLK